MFSNLRVTVGLLSSHVIKKLRPGNHGTLRWAEKFGDRLLCVRYRLDESGENRYTTVEILVDERATRKPLQAKLDRMVFVRVGGGEKAVQKTIKDAGGKWNPKECLWTLPYGKAKALNMLPRIVKSVEI